MSRFDDKKEIGGKEYGLINWEFDGDTEKARMLIGVGRKYLGIMKQQMQLAKVAYKINTTPLPDGVSIVTESNKIGLVDIDKVSIYVPPTPNPPNPKGPVRVLGYVVQGFCDISVGAANDRRVTYTVTMPSGDTMGYWDDYLWDEYFPYESIDFYIIPYAPPVLSDNGAKYVPYAYGKDTEVTGDWLYEDPPKYQNVTLVGYSGVNSFTGAPYAGYAEGGYGYHTAEGTQSYIIVRRSDKNGFFGDVGFDMGSGGFTIEQRDDQHGHGFLFMVPMGEAQSFRNSDAIKTSQSTYWNGRGLGETIIFADRFGMPCKCEEGKHRVVAGRYNNSVTLSKLVVWLQVQDMSNGAIDMVKKTINVTDFVTVGKRDLSKIITIQVGETTRDQLPSMVSTVSNDNQV